MRIGLLLLAVVNVKCIDFRYHSHDEGTDLLKQLNQTFPDICLLYSIGTSELGRELWVLKLSENARKRTPGRPRVKSVANMHGDETVSRALMFQLAQFLTEGYNSDPLATSTLKNYELHLMPSLNPDGYERSKEGNCGMTGRANGKKIDLNRNFPDQWRDAAWKVGDPTLSTGTTIAMETQAMIDWILNSRFVLSLNLHAGSEVASYGWDGKPVGTRGAYSRNPDDSLLQHLSHTYADAHTTMHKMDGAACGDVEHSFHNGITNGAEWYPLAGGMEDFNYIYGDCVEITVELTCCKYPKAETLENEWNRNKAALFAFIQASDQTIHGFIVDQDGQPLDHVNIDVKGIDKTMHSDINGDFWRPLVPGNYEVSFSKEGFDQISVNLELPLGGLQHNITLNVEKREADIPQLEDSKVIEESEATAQKAEEIDVEPEVGEALEPDEKHTIEIKHDEIKRLNLTLEFNPFKHRTHEELTSYFRKLTDKYPSLSRLYSIGKSVQGRDLWVVEISDNPGVHELYEPELKMVAAMHGNEASSQTTAVAFITDLLTGYGSDSKIAEFVEKNRIHVLATMNPDGHEAATLEIRNKGPKKSAARTGSFGRDNMENIDLNRNFPFPTQSKHGVLAKETELIMDWSKKNFVLSLNVHNGGLVSNYPYDDNYFKKNEGLGRLAKGAYSKCDDDDVFRVLAGSYASGHPTMSNGEGCQDDLIGIQEDPKTANMYGHEVFEGGITNGAEWYEVAGSMQDWNYFYTNTLEVTVEIGCLKYPSEQYLKQYWESNRKSIYSYYSFASVGLTGRVFDVKEYPISDARIEILDNGSSKPRSHYVKSLEHGDFFRPLLPGSYSVTIHKPGFRNHTEEISITPGAASILEVALFRATPEARFEEEELDDEGFFDSRADVDLKNVAYAPPKSLPIAPLVEDFDEDLYQAPEDENFDEEPELIDASLSLNSQYLDERPLWEENNSGNIINIFVYGVTAVGVIFCGIILYRKRHSRHGAGTFQFNRIGVDDQELLTGLLTKA